MMRRASGITLFAILLLVVALPVSAQERTLSNNTTSDSTVWFISGEASLVMNGFDLQPLGVTLPAAITSVSITVESPVPNTPIDVVVYQDGNGGSPVDAELAGRAEVQINSAGVYTARFPTPVLVSQPVIWVGFYLPVDFEFLADTSGSSVLTYWAWSEGSRFGLSSLSNAQILGPADGTAPVNLDMGGVARITATLSTSGDTINTAQFASQLDIDDLGGDVLLTSDISVLRQYEGCETLSYDGADVRVSLRDGLDYRCQELYLGFAPADPLGFERRQLLYDLAFFADYGVVVGNLAVAVTHCIEPNPDDVGQELFVGVGTGAPRTWRILPSARVGNLVCAELPSGGLVSYFIRAEEDDDDD